MRTIYWISTPEGVGLILLAFADADDIVLS